MTTAPARQPLQLGSAEEVLDALRAAGHRVSRPSRVVVDALFAAEGPLTAEQIADGGGGEPVELTSVYRNLERLERLGVVSHVHAGHGPGLYALARAGAGDPEDLVCDSCGAIAVADPAALEQVRRAIRRAFGHEASFTHFPMHGRCRDCAAAGG